MAESHAAATHPAGEHAGGGAPHATVATYVRIAVVLTVITAIEVATLYVPGIPHVLLVTSLLVMSLIKFALVVGFYMHLRYDPQVLRALFVGPLLISIAIILALMALFSAFLLLPRP
ncbi:MAG TPA: cytochrome C oxidase subunit IV family protein [Methylomirabilota bacterium]|nr:cytochrome C oxidase subunit IV family protein [Methylomirabilota bacterium]